MAFLSHDMRCHAGVMISASHNPYQDNGIKFFSSDGYKLPIRSRTDRERRLGRAALAAGERRRHRARAADDAQGRYVVFLKSPSRRISRSTACAGADCANGAAQVGPTVLRAGRRGLLLGSGRNINDGCGSLFPRRLRPRCASRAPTSGSLDGDADRAVLVRKGSVADGDALALFGREMSRAALRGGRWWPP
jgi:phosphoglucosamine mutase